MVKMVRLLCSIFVILVLSQRLFAEAGFSYREEVDRKIVQRLEWTKNAAAYNYFIEIQRQEGARWVDTLQETTENNYLELSLPHGAYRYRVTPSDLLGRRSAAAEWARLVIMQIFQPEITGCSPDTIYLEDVEKAMVIIDLTGENLRSGAKVLLRGARDADIEGRELSAHGDGKYYRVEFEKAKLQTGVFDIVLENPGGLKAVLHNFRIAKANSEVMGLTGAQPLFFYLTEGYAPAIAFPGVFNDFFKRQFFEIGGVVRAGWTPFSIAKCKWGFEFQSSYHYLSAPVKDTGYSEYKINAQAVELRGNIIFNIPIVKRLSINVRAGGGVVILTDIHLQDDRLSSPPKSGWIPHIGGGLSLSFLLFSTLYIEGGADILYTFSVDNPPPMYIMPSIAIGFKF